MTDQPLEFRYDVRPDDRESVRRLVESTGVFSPVEADVAVELVDERLAKGPQSDYQFVFAEQQGRTVGYTCYGPIALTAASFDLYWIAVDKSLHGRKIGRLLLEKTEELIRHAGGRQVYIETSNRHHYAATRGFYLRCGYRQEALLKDFYAPGDDKVIYVKELEANVRSRMTNGPSSSGRIGLDWALPSSPLYELRHPVAAFQTACLRRSSPRRSPPRVWGSHTGRGGPPGRAYLWSTRRSNPSFAFSQLSQVAAGDILGSRRTISGSKTSNGNGGCKKSQTPQPIANSRDTAPSSRAPCRHPQAAPARGRLGSSGPGSRAQIGPSRACNDVPQRQATVSPDFNALDRDLLAAHAGQQVLGTHLGRLPRELGQQSPFGSLTHGGHSCRRRAMRLNEPRSGRVRACTHTRRSYSASRPESSRESVRASTHPTWLAPRRT